MTPVGISGLKSDEGFRAHIYSDTVDVQTIGYGTNLKDGITELQATGLLEVTLSVNRAHLAGLSWFVNMTPARQDVIENMCYNIGFNEVLRFTGMIAAIEAKNYQLAACDMLNSTWAKQVGHRAARLSSIMRG